MTVDPFVFGVLALVWMVLIRHLVWLYDRRRHPHRTLLDYTLIQTLELDIWDEAYHHEDGTCDLGGYTPSKATPPPAPIDRRGESIGQLTIGGKTYYTQEGRSRLQQAQYELELREQRMMREKLKADAQERLREMAAARDREIAEHLLMAKEAHLAVKHGKAYISRDDWHESQGR